MQMTKEKLGEFIKEIVGEVTGDYNQEIKDLKEAQESSFEKLYKASQMRNGGNPEKGLGVARLIRGLLAGKGDPERAVKYIEKHWTKTDNSEVIKALAAGDGVAGGFTVNEDMSSEVIELLRPAQVVRRANPIIMPMGSGNMTLPGLASGAQSNYSGENVNGGVSEPTFRQVKMVFKKLITLVPVSNDLIRYSSSASDTIVRDDLVNAMGQRSDVAFLRGDGLQDTPKGWRNLVLAANTFDANATVNLDNVTKDLANLILRLSNGESRMIRPSWFFAPRTELFLMTIRDGNGNYAFRDEMLTGNFWGWPYFKTNSIPTNLGGGSDESEIYLVDMADTIIGESQSLILDASGEAAYHDGSNVQAAFSKDQTVIRAIAEHDFNMRHLESLAIMTAVRWLL